MMKTLLLIFLATIPCHANRAVMEGLAVSNNTLYIDTVNVRVGISTITAQTTLDVAGNAQIGLGANKSTVTATGALVMASGSSITLKGAAGNIVSASSITTTGAFFGDGSHLTPATIISTQNVNNTMVGKTFANTTYGPCIADSTLTMTTNGNLRIHMKASIGYQDATSGNLVGFQFLQDGKFVGTLSNSFGMYAAQPSLVSSNDAANAAINWYIPVANAPASGSHSYCIAGEAGSGQTVTVCGAGSGAQCQIMIEEIP